MIRTERTAYPFLHGWPQPPPLLAVDTHGWHLHQPSSQQISIPVKMNIKYFITLDMFDLCILHILQQVVVLTGGGVFWRHSSRYTILASSLTYSTSCSNTHTKNKQLSQVQTILTMHVPWFRKHKPVSVKDKHTWMTSKLAAPALPTLIVMGLTRALFAKFWIFFGIVALKSRVCLCP